MRSRARECSLTRLTTCWQPMKKSSDCTSGKQRWMSTRAGSSVAKSKTRPAFFFELHDPHLNALESALFALNALVSAAPIFKGLGHRGFIASDEVLGIIIIAEPRRRTHVGERPPSRPGVDPQISAGHKRRTCESRPLSLLPRLASTGGMAANFSVCRAD
jgi:hypothetical protein